MWRKARLWALASVASVAALTGCGSSDIEGNVSPEDANLLKADLTAVQDAAALGDCEALTTRARGFLESVNELPATAGADLKSALRDSADHLMTLANDKCPSGTTGPTGSTSSSSTTSTTPTSPATTTRPTTTSTTTTSTKEEPPPAGGGGGENGGGNEGGNGNGSGGGVGGGTGGTGGVGGGD